MATSPQAGIPPATVAAVANEFLALAANEGLENTIDQMKLQKLLFYAHAWNLAYGNGPLFEDDFEAWPWGPVVRAAYMQTLDCGRGPVRSLLSEFASTPSGYKITTPEGVREDLKPFIKSVWDTLKSYSGIQLSNSTHADGEPWTIIAETLGTETKPVIPNSLIAEVFRKKLPHGVQAAAATA